MADTVLPSAQDKARELLQGLEASGRIKLEDDPGSATAAASVPSFSNGTVPLDESSGRPIVPPAGNVPPIDAGKVALPGPTETTGGTAAAADAGTQAPAAVAPAAQAAGTVAAEAAAAAVTDRWGQDYDEFEIDDPDHGLKVPVRTTKAHAEFLRRAIPRRQDYDRTMNRFREAAPGLEKIIAEGQMRNLLPLIQRALSDPAYGDYVVRGFQRIQQGLPLIEAAAREAAAAAQAPPPPTQTPGFEFPGFEFPGFEDPLIAAAVQPLATRYQTLEEKFAALERQQTAAQQQQRAQQAQQHELANAFMSAHRDLESTYPGEFNTRLGPNDPAYQRALQFAQESGYIESYGARAGLVFGGQAFRQVETERLAATASPAAAAIAGQDARLTELARQQAIAAAQAGGGGGATSAPPVQPTQKPTLRNPDGSLKPASQVMAENLGYLQAARTG